MKKYEIKRILQLIPILFALTFISYGMMRIAGSDVVPRGRRDPSPARHNPLLQSDFRAFSRTGSAGGSVYGRCGILRMAHRAQNPGAGLVLEPAFRRLAGDRKNEVA